MKKIFMIICLFCGFVGDSWAVCELTESTDLTPSDEDLYPQDPNVSRMALICEKGKCEDGEIVLAKKGHYRKNTLIDEGEFYECKLGVNDRWEPFDFKSEFPVCGDISDKEVVSIDTKDMSYGTKVADNLYVDLCRKEYDEKCGVKCTPENEDKNFYCDNAVIVCFEGTFGEYASFFGTCEYSDPQTRIDNYIIENEWIDKMSFWGAYVLHDGEVVNSDMNVCQGCKSGLFYGGDGYCYSNLDQAWCNWRKNKDGKNVEWVDDNHCECKDTGMEWKTEQHDCVKSGKGGKTGAGKTNTNMGNKKSNSKTGSGKADEKCGVKCNKKTSGKWISCDYEFFTCFDNNDDSNRVIEWQKLHPDLMVIEPCLLLDPSTPKGDNQAMSVYVGDYHDNDTVAIFNKKQDGSFVEETDLCFLCEGEYKYFDIARLNHKDGKECTNNEQLAWCNWRKVKENINTNWQNDECKCLDTGRKWDKETHNCVVDTGGKTSPQSKNNNIDCVVELGASVQCKNGTKFNKNATVSLSAEKCNLYKSNVAKYLNEIAGLLCEKSGGVGNIITDAQVKAATDNINRFFEYAKSNANVWKNADGKFNTARLASDATAGVILGTVGGIVSAKIIKKKQVEKGFDALNCTVGGQKVADFGDEFTIGFGR